MTIANGTAVNQPAAVPEQLPINRWVERHMKAGGDVDDIVAASRLVDELRCADAIAETVAPGMFGIDAKLALRECLSQIKVDLEDDPTSELDDHKRVIHATQESPIGQWLMTMSDQRRAASNPHANHQAAIDMAAARDILSSLQWAQAAGRSVSPAWKANLTPIQAVAVVNALWEHQDRLAAQQEAYEKQNGAAQV